MSKQLSFNLPAKTALGREDFFVSPANAAPVALIEGWQGWPGRKLLLIGSEGSGKTHLTHVWAGQSAARILDASALADLDIQAFAGQSVAVEYAEQVAGDKGAETALFHLHNLVLAEGGALLITANAAPSRWGIHLPDLKSRMEGTTIAHLDAPDDLLLSAVLVKLFDDRQIAVPANLIDYVLPRMDRSLAAAAKLVAQLDHAALSEGRSLTRALAARILNKDFGTGT